VAVIYDAALREPQANRKDIVHHEGHEDHEV
jgi:hypothetical protein